MPLLDDQLNQAIKDGITPVSDRFKWLSNYKHLIGAGKSKEITSFELNKNLEDAKSLLNSLKNENAKYEPNQVDDDFEFEKVNQTLYEVNQEIESTVKTIKRMVNLCPDNQKPIEINQDSLKATYELMKTTQLIKNSFLN